MNILLDTHIFHWLEEYPEKISSNAKHFLASYEHNFFVSDVTFWEFALLTNSNKNKKGLIFKNKDKIDAFINKILLKNNIDTLSISPLAAKKFYELPTYHSDIFDRMIIAQALSMNMAII